MKQINIRIQNISLYNFKNVEFGTINFPSSKDNNFSFADLVGVYGQNGSGKTALIDALSVLKIVLSGGTLPSEYINFIKTNSSFAKLKFTFSIMLNKLNYKVEYSFDIKKVELQNNSNFDVSAQKSSQLVIENEILKLSGMVDGKNTNLQTIIDTNTEDLPFFPKTKYEKFIGNDKSLTNKLLVNRQLAYERSQSFIFMKETLKVFDDNCSVQVYKHILKDLMTYGNFYLYVIDTKSAGLINLNAALPFFFRLNNDKTFSTGSVAVKLEGSSTIPVKVYKIIKDTIVNMNSVLEQIIPGLNIELKKLGTTLLQDSSEAYSVELISNKNGVSIPLRYESEGIKKIISILQLLIVMYNNSSMTVAIDELDAGVFEYLLGEIIKIISQSGKGQLIFTSHNLRPLEIIDKKFVFFTTTNSQNRYIQLENVQSNNNLRNFYYRDILLGVQKEELYERTNNYEIALSFLEAGENNAN